MLRTLVLHLPTGKLSPFDADCLFSSYDADTRAWLISLDPASATTDEGKAVIVTEAAYPKKFDANDLDMVEDVEFMLAQVAGNTTSLGERTGSSTFSASSRHVVYGALARPFFHALVEKAVALTFDGRGSSQQVCVPWKESLLYKLVYLQGAGSLLLYYLEIVQLRGRNVRHCERLL
ncbi:hypothetical protein N7520_004955 [Penicillium odoratum]|uniref:uncharacterized protein n=1 Tax=Penicillium odoratum TaxID=1167516 RepID=UPI0025473193|nr:uncharacterized protein N7520_004955 [Penicillium odoratum]KAJ5765396.1 hypothetical protein N7520_004955 [Penicillium odoratum]